MKSLNQIAQESNIGGMGDSKSSSGGVSDFLPSVLGTVGQIGGGLLGGLGGGAVGTVAEPGGGTLLGGIGGERIGQTLGGAGGQALGEAISELIQGKPLNWGNIGMQGGQGLLWSQVPGGKAGAGILKNLAVRGLGGAGIGAATQAMQNVEQRKPLGQDVLTSGGLAGAINALAPGAGKILGTPLKMLAGTSEGVLNKVSKFLVGDELARDPEIVQHLDLRTGDWKKSQDNLISAADQIYKPIVDVASQKTASLNDFLKSLKNGMIQEKDMTSDKIKANISNVRDFILRNMERKNPGSTANLPPEVIQVPGDILNEAKKVVGKWYQNGEYNPAYTEAKNFIEKMAPEVDVAGINKKYGKYIDAIDKLDKNFANERFGSEMTRGMGWMQRIAMIAGTAMTAGSLGLPLGSLYGAAGGAGAIPAAYVFTALKDAAMKTPERATQYARFLEKAGPSLQTALQQLLLRGSTNRQSQ